MRIVACDTETVRGKPWSIQVRDDISPNAEIYYCRTPQEMGIVKECLEQLDTLTVLHNAKFDLRVLAQCGIYPARCECTMQMAYLLGEPRLSLKVLAYRIAGIEMRTYADVTHEATQEKADADQRTDQYRKAQP